MEILGQNNKHTEGSPNGVIAGSTRTRAQSLWLAWPGSGAGFGQGQVGSSGWQE